MEIIDGNRIAAELVAELKSEVAAAAGRRPCLALVRVGDGWAIEDLGSTNGTLVEGRRVPAGTRVALTDGVTMTLGRTRLTFRIS